MRSRTDLGNPGVKTAPRVLHLCAVEPTAQRFLLAQLRGLDDVGYDVRLACSMDDWSPDLAPFDPVSIPFPRSLRPAAVTRAMLSLGRLIRQMAPDIVHLHTPAVALPARLLPKFLEPAGTKTVYTVHGFAHQWDEPDLRDRVLQRTEKWLAPRTDALLFQSA